MTTNDTVTIPRELAERIYSDMAFGAAANELAAILNPPPEFDSEMVRAIARELYSQAPFDDVPYDKVVREHEGYESDVRQVLAAARSAGWEMGEADELVEKLSDRLAEVEADLGMAERLLRRLVDWVSPPGWSATHWFFPNGHIDIAAEERAYLRSLEGEGDSDEWPPRGIEEPPPAERLREDR